MMAFKLSTVTSLAAVLATAVDRRHWHRSEVGISMAFKPSRKPASSLGPSERAIPGKWWQASRRPVSAIRCLPPLSECNIHSEYHLRCNPRLPRLQQPDESFAEHPKSKFVSWENDD